MGVSAFPLSWPAGWDRTRFRDRAKFSTLKTVVQSGGDFTRKVRSDRTIEQAALEVEAEVERLGAANCVISSNVELNLSGRPRSNRSDPSDPGVAVYFTLDGRQQCIPCDRWDRVADNLWAISKSIEALRGLERWGAKAMVDAAFRGFKALPERGTGDSWYKTLRLEPSATEEEIRSAYRTLAMETHPDRGGSAAAFTAVQEALRQGLQAVAQIGRTDR